MNTPTPDYGEPWSAFIHDSIVDKDNNWTACTEMENIRDRIIACVNACAGMADPAKEIQAMREKLEDKAITHLPLVQKLDAAERQLAACMADSAKEIARFKSCSDELDSILSVIPEDEPCHHAETGEMVTDYILDLQKEVGRVHALYFNTSQQLEAMREAIREAHEAIKASPYPDQQALAKLQPFIPTITQP